MQDVGIHLDQNIWRFSDAARNLMELTHSDQSEVVPEVKPVASSQGWKHMIVAITCIVTYSPCFTTYFLWFCTQTLI